MENSRVVAMIGRPGQRSSSMTIWARTSAQATNAVPWAVTGVFAPAVGRAQGCTGTPYFALRYRISASMCL